MVAKIDPFVWHHATPMTITWLNVAIFKLKYFSTHSTKINEALLPDIAVYAESNEHKIALWVLKFTDLLSLKVCFKNTICQKISKVSLL